MTEFDIDNRMNIRANRAPVSIAGDRIELYGYMSDSNKTQVANILEMVPVDKYATVQPFCTIEKDKAQVLMDDLWQAGLRPSEGTGSAGSLKATQNHLKDLKTILFHKLGIPESK